MKKINKLCLLTLALMASTLVAAQQATTPLERRIIEKALDNFEMYKSCITVADDETRSYFMDLFKDRSVPVYNDLLGLSGKSKMTVTDYLNEQRSKMVSPIIKISNVRRDKIWEENGNWMIQFSFDKSLSYQNPCGINFNTQEFYGKMFRETMVLSYDEGNEECQIVSITGKIDSDRFLPEDYCILDSTSIKDLGVIYKGNDGKRQHVKFNSFGQMLLTAGHEKNQFVYSDRDVVVKSTYNPDCHLIKFTYKSYHWRIKPYFSLGLGEALSVSNKSFFRTVESKSNSYGLDAGYIFSSKGKIKFGAFLGLGITNSTLDLAYDKSQYMFTTNQDVDGDEYNRIYTDLNLSQTTKMTEFSIPVYADVDWRFSSWVSFYLNLGVVLNINMSRKINTFSGSASEVYGIYPQYDDLRLDEQWGYNGFKKNLNLSSGNLCSSERVSVNKFVPDLLVGAGFRVNIPSTPLSIDLGIGYRRGLTDLITVTNNTHANQYSANLVYNEYSGSNSIEHVHDMVESAGAVSRSSLRLNMGLILKF